MIKLTNLLFTASTLFLVGVGCSKKNESASADPSASSNKPGEQHTTTTASDCSAARHGPMMVQVQTPNGVNYCMDRTGVTQAQYKEFLESANEDKSFQDARCGSDNPSYVPYVSADYCSSFQWTADGSRPMTCVDWCDANAYCKWAGKKLCGKVGGGTNDAPPVVLENGDRDLDMSKGLDANLSQWYNACTQGGQTAYFNGDTLNVEGCPDSDDSASSCHGSLSPYDQILDLGAKVGEWEDLCGPDDCAVRGTRWSLGGNGRCDDLRGYGGKTGLASGLDHVGFRCCSD